MNLTLAKVLSKMVYQEVFSVSKYGTFLMSEEIIKVIFNKSAAGMQNTLPRDIFNAKKIILKLDLFMQSLKKIGKETPKIESEKKNLKHRSRAVSLYFCRNLSICDTKTLLFNINSYTQFEENR